MSDVRDWSAMREMSARLLQERTGENVEAWNRRIRESGFSDEAALRRWLAQEGVTGYAQSLLVMETFGYPVHLVASADELLDAQYADRPQLRPILDAIIQATVSLGQVTIQARKGYVSFISPRRTFVRLRPTTKTRVDVGLRLEGVEPVGRLTPSTIHETTKVQISLGTPEEVDAEVLDWLQLAYDQNA
jgi:hypothetical protein